MARTLAQAGVRTGSADLEWVNAADLEASGEQFEITRVWEYTYSSREGEFHKIGFEIIRVEPPPEDKRSWAFSLGFADFRADLLEMGASEGDPVGPVRLIKGAKGKRGNSPYLLEDVPEG